MNVSDDVCVVVGERLIDAVVESDDERVVLADAVGSWVTERVGDFVGEGVSVPVTSCVNPERDTVCVSVTVTSGDNVKREFDKVAVVVTENVVVNERVPV